jgi:hypothetical protein
MEPIYGRPYGADLKTLSFCWFYKLDFKTLSYLTKTNQLEQFEKRRLYGAEF